MRVIKWPRKQAEQLPLPKPIKRPCDYGLDLAVGALETQLGTIEAYNRMVRMTELLKLKIGNGDAIACNPLYANEAGGLV